MTTPTMDSKQKALSDFEWLVINFIQSAGGPLEKFGRIQNVRAALQADQPQTVEIESDACPECLGTGMVSDQHSCRHCDGGGLVSLGVLSLINLYANGRRIEPVIYNAIVNHIYGKNAQGHGKPSVDVEAIKRAAVSYWKKYENGDTDNIKALIDHLAANGHVRGEV